MMLSSSSVVRVKATLKSIEQQLKSMYIQTIELRSPVFFLFIFVQFIIHLSRMRRLCSAFGRKKSRGRRFRSLEERQHSFLFMSVRFCSYDVRTSITPVCNRLACEQSAIQASHLPVRFQIDLIAFEMQNTYSCAFPLICTIYLSFCIFVFVVCPSWASTFLSLPLSFWSIAACRTTYRRSPS